jgi:arsenate reductase-like glutaredoxin family protein
MRRIYYLSTCDTCAKIIAEVKPPKDMELIDIKATNIDGDTLDWLKGKVGSYEEMFSKRALKYRSMGLNEMKLTENDYRKYMLEEYTFLRRPFFIYDDTVFIGNSPKTVKEAVDFFSKL